MHLLLAPLLTILLYGCQSALTPIDIETHTAYVHNYILPEVPQARERCIILAINKDFCGSCTDQAVAFIHSTSLLPIRIITVSDQDIRGFLPDSMETPQLTSLVVPLDIQQRKGFFSTMNRIYFLLHGRIEEAYYITDESVNQVRRQLNRWIKRTSR